MSGTLKKNNFKQITLESFLKDKIGRMNNINTLNQGYPYSINSIKNYEKLLNVWKKFEMYYDVGQLSFSDISLETYYRFLNYCCICNYSDKTKFQYAKLLKMVMNIAYEESISKNLIQTSKQFCCYPRTDSTTRVYLNDSEINSIYNLYLPKGSIKEKVRDLFLMGCYTGQRFSDYSLLSNDKIIKISVNNNNYSAFNIIQQKTKTKVTIPIIYSEVFEILNRWNGKLPMISISSINKNIKEICKIAGIDQIVSKYISFQGKNNLTNVKKYEMVSSHTARRSFITNAYNKGILDTYQIRYISGHKSDISFKKYICNTGEEDAILILQKMIKSGYL